jgi:hypothetical protein
MAPERPGPRVVARPGRYALRLPEAERDLLRGLLGELRELLALSPDDPRARRLYPTAYREDAEEDAEYQRLMREELLTIRVDAADTVEATLDAVELSPEQLAAWMQAVNSLRLVLGTLLEVDEDHDPFALDPSDPEARPHVLYGYLGVLLEEIVQAQLS